MGDKAALDWWPGETLRVTLVEATASVIGQRQLLHGAQDSARGGPSGLHHKHGLAHPTLRAQPARDRHLRRRQREDPLASRRPHTCKPDSGV